MHKNNILVIIVAFNSMQWADKCYNSLRASTIPCDIITIDNGSSDGTPDYIRKKFPEVELIETGENIGFGKANNIGLQKVLDEEYEYAYLLNQDAWIEQNTFEELIKASKLNPQYGILSPMQMQADMQHFDYGFIYFATKEPQRNKPILAEDWYFNRSAGIYEVSFVMAAHWLLTRKCIKTVGGFSPAFPHYGEDCNYIDRTLYNNLKVGIVPKALAVHDRSDKKWSKEKNEYILHYSCKLQELSNPFHRPRVINVVVKLINLAIKEHNKNIYHYAIRILKERKIINSCYGKSFARCAFLKENRNVCNSI